MNILFHSNQIGERGTEVVMFDYALGNQNVLKNHSFIAAPKNGVHDVNVLDKFKQNFSVCLYESSKEIQDFIESNKIDLVYKIVHGGMKEELLHDKIPHFINCVFSTKAKHGTFYCPISEYLNKWFRTKYPVFPHIVKKFSGNTETLREKLSIPNDAVVFGGYGGEERFNIPFAHQAIMEVAKKRKDIYFIFLNFHSFEPSGEKISNIMFLPKNVDRDYKEIFINTCDAMIHARADGETFGLAVAEFSVKNKPVITWAPTFCKNTKFILRTFKRYLKNNHLAIYSRAHLDYLGDKAIKYTGIEDLKDIFCNFKEKYLKEINYDCYSEIFSEEKVMRRFQDIINDFDSQQQKEQV
jgi:hypothetical protein